MKAPNYTMLRLMLMEYHLVLSKYKDCEQMPEDKVFNGCDVKLIPALAVLNYIYGIKTQWSCQGNHKDYISCAYILLNQGFFFPKELLNLILKNNLVHNQVPDVLFENNAFVETEKTREKITVSKNTDSIEKENDLFVSTITEWANQEIKKHLSSMKGSYFSDIRNLYS